MQTYLGEAVVAGGVRSVRFRAGDILSAHDLNGMQEGLRTQFEQFLRAEGPGVRQGLDVSRHGTVDAAQGPALHISPGLAVSPAGHLLWLDAPVELLLQGGAFGSGKRSAFAPRPHSGLAAGILVLRAATVSPPEAPVPSDGRMIHAQPQPLAGVVFHVVPLRPGQLPPDDALAWNRLAASCCGLIDPAAVDENGQQLYQPLLPDQLSPEDLPLALLGWRDGTLAFVETWPVRRTPEGGSVPAWVPGGHRIPAQAAALSRHFQHYLRTLQANGDPAQVCALDHFAFLPPVGQLPIGPDGFAVETFFAGFPLVELAWDDAFVNRHLQEGLQVAPITVAELPPVGIYRPPGGSHVIFARQPRGAAALVEAIADELAGSAEAEAAAAQEATALERLFDSAAQLSQGDEGKVGPHSRPKGPGLVKRFWRWLWVLD